MCVMGKLRQRLTIPCNAPSNLCTRYVDITSSTTQDDRIVMLFQE